jgi:hypothetical protein
MQLIGGSIQEAIDWTQDHLLTTRPLAERTLFSMLTDKKVRETADGFMLIEADGEEDMRKRHKAMRHGRGPSRPFRSKSRKMNPKKQYKRRLDYSDAAEDMIDAADGSDNNALS